MFFKVGMLQPDIHGIPRLLTGYKVQCLEKGMYVQLRISDSQMHY